MNRTEDNLTNLYKPNSNRNISSKRLWFTFLVSPSSLSHLVYCGLMWFAGLILQITSVRYLFTLGSQLKVTPAVARTTQSGIRKKLFIRNNIKELGLNIDCVHNFFQSFSFLVLLLTSTCIIPSSDSTHFQFSNDMFHFYFYPGLLPKHSPINHQFHHHPKCHHRRQIHST